MLPQRVLEELEKKSREYGTRRILVQLPEGLKPRSSFIAKELKDNEFEPVISADPCFGACDVRVLDDTITLHIGHSRMLDIEPVVYWEYRYDIDPWPAINDHLPEIHERRIGLITTVQHIGFIEKVKRHLESAGKEVHVGNPSVRVTYHGQVLGCDASTAVSIKGKVDAFLYFGSGVFHPMYVAFQTRKKVYAVDPFSEEFQVVGWGGLEKERALRITKAMNSKNFGVVTSVKPGQYFPEVTKELVERIRKEGYEASEVIADFISPDVLDALGFDCIVIAACPRIVLDDWKNYKTPILLPDELYSLLEIK